MTNTFMNNSIIDADMEDIYNRGFDWNEFKNKTILITGATGMLASYVTYFFIFLNERHNMNISIKLLVRNIDKVKNKFNIYVTRKYLSVIENNINASLTVDGDVNYIIHAASLASPQYYKTNPVEVAAPNVLGTYYLLELARKKKVSGFLYFSSGDVYGKIVSENNCITEDMAGSLNQLDIHSCYGESKRMGETWCSSFAREYNLPVSIARIAHTYGPTMDINNDPRVFSAFMKCIYEGKNIIMFSDGSAKRPFCYIADAVAGFLLILLKGKSGEAYNVSNNDEFISIAALAKTLISLRPELQLKIDFKKRKANDSYIDNKANKDNKPSDKKLKSLGWNCHFNCQVGFGRVLKYLYEKEHEKP